MPDRDPALEAALNDFRKRGNIWVDGMAMFAAGWHAAFRSLGCATPEAQVALRELVTAVHQHEANLLTVTDQTPIGELGRLLLQLERPARAFARVATPPEEGR